jgi:penicillin-binding protein 1C
MKALIHRLAPIMPSPSRRSARSWLRRLALLSFLSWLAWRGLRWQVGQPDLVSGSAIGTRVLAHDGRLLGARRDARGLLGSWVPIDEISPHLRAATLASEDKRFETHDGIDRIALARALLSNLAHLRVLSGASTIPSQLVKQVDFEGRPHKRTLWEKLREMARAQNLATSTTRTHILEHYMNRLDYGRGYAGPEAAARGYFGVGAGQLSLAQSTFLAVIPRAPSALDPFRHRARVELRQQALLRSMRKRGLISEADFQRAQAEPIILQTPSPKAMLAPHLVLAASRKHSGVVQTTIDWDLQSRAEATVAAHRSRLRDRNATNIAAVLVDHATGEVLAEVGSASYFDRRIAGAVDLVHRRRQAGSTLKPLLYARYFDGDPGTENRSEEKLGSDHRAKSRRAGSPLTLIADVATEFGRAHAVYAPENFDGTFLGPVLAREALAGSLNVPAVKVAEHLGQKGAESTLRAFGIAPAKEGSYGLSIALGTVEITPWDLATAYATLARGGTFLPLRDGVFETTSDAPDRKAGPDAEVVSSETAAEVAEVLSDPIARIRGLHARGPFEFPYPVAVKTGTSSGFRDTWTAGFSRDTTIVVWVGNDSGAPTDHLTGATAAGPIFFDLMQAATEVRRLGAPAHGGARQTARSAMAARDDLVTVEVCPLSGELASSACPDRVSHRVTPTHRPSHRCTLHQHVVKVPTFRCASTNDGDRVSIAVLLPDEYKSFVLGRRQGANTPHEENGIPWLLRSEVLGCSESSVQRPKVTMLEPAPEAEIVGEWDARNSAMLRVVRVRVATEGMSSTESLEVAIDQKSALLMGSRREALVPMPLGEHWLSVRPVRTDLAAEVAQTRVRVR